MKLNVKVPEVLVSTEEESQAQKDRGLKQLLRLGTLVDVIFGLMLFRLFFLMPRPEVDNFGAAELVEVLRTSYLNYAAMIVGVILVIIYWQQSNLIFGNLERTDSKHATISVLQTFCLMLYLYFVRLDMEFDAAIITLKMQSVTLAFAGFLAILSWWYAIRKGLITNIVNQEEEYSVYLKLFPEPLVAAISFIFTFFGPLAWNLSWLLLIPVTMLVKRNIKKRKIKSESQQS